MPTTGLVWVAKASGLRIAIRSLAWLQAFFRSRTPVEKPETDVFLLDNPRGRDTLSAQIHRAVFSGWQVEATSLRGIAERKMENGHPQQVLYLWSAVTDQRAEKPHLESFYSDVCRQALSSTPADSRPWTAGMRRFCQ